MAVIDLASAPTGSGAGVVVPLASAGVAARTGGQGEARPRILLCTIGTLGDLSPFIAIGLGLRRLGYEPTLCVASDHVPLVERLGLDARAILPPFGTMLGELGLTEREATARMLVDQDFMIREVALRWLARSAEAIDAAAGDSVAVVASFFAIGGGIVAEKRGLPLIRASLQPLTNFSRHDPPVGQGFLTIGGARVGAAVRLWNGACLRVVRAELRRRYARRIDGVRAAHGLGPAGGTPIIDADGATATLGLYSSLLSPGQPDFALRFRHVGFPAVDLHHDEGRDPELDEFLSRGPPPIVFTLGSFATSAPGDFFEQSVRAARLLGRRALLLTGTEPTREEPDALRRRYVPHSRVFPSAAVVVHHGGIGTLGQALAAGRPQLVVPQMRGDQWDNAARARRLGVAEVLSAGRYRAGTAAAAIGRLLDDGRRLSAARRASALLASEDGGTHAARAVDDELRRLGVVPVAGA